MSHICDTGLISVNWHLLSFVYHNPPIFTLRHIIFRQHYFDCISKTDSEHNEDALKEPSPERYKITSEERDVSNSVVRIPYKPYCSRDKIL